MFDTDILIWYFRGNQNAREFVMRVPYEDRAASSLCLMELIQGCLYKSEIKTVKEFFKANISTVIHPDERICERAILLLERHALSDGLRTLDSLIAASVWSKNAALATGNYKHFKKIPGLTLLKFALHEKQTRKDTEARG